jgi:hypothetical protein
MHMKKILFAATAMLAVGGAAFAQNAKNANAVAVGMAAGSYANSVTYRGQGLTSDGFGDYDLNTELCGVVNGADAEGPYLLWVFTANKAGNADITGPWGTAAMTKTGNGTFKYVSGWYAPSTLPGVCRRPMTAAPRTRSSSSATAAARS